MNVLPKRTRIAFDASPVEYKALTAAAEAAGIPVNTLSRALFRWALPLFASEGFNVAALKQRYGKGEVVPRSLDKNAGVKARFANMNGD